MEALTAPLYERGYVIAGKYELEYLLGQGGMGDVWRAHNLALDSPVAIKVLTATGDRAALKERLVKEARAAAQLTHSAIVKVFDVGQTDRADPFIVMELLPGSSLGTLLSLEGPLPAEQAVRTLLPIADALSVAHSKGIVHRDVKPDNVFIVQDEGSTQPKLVDFGIVKLQHRDGDSHLTQAGAVLGSPDYMSPEQARGQDDIDHRTDVWSFSVVLYEAISARVPFEAVNYNALLRQIVEDTPTTLSELGLADDQLSSIVARGLSKQRDERFSSMAELGQALAKWLVAHDIHEDICGMTVEGKWLRSSERPHGRVPSLHEAWPGEVGSGVRPSGPRAMSTFPAPAPPLPPAPAAAAVTAVRSRWLGLTVVVAAALLVPLVLVWLAQQSSRDTPVQVPTTAVSGLPPERAVLSPPATARPEHQPAAAAPSASVEPAPELLTTPRLAPRINTARSTPKRVPAASTKPATTEAAEPPKTPKAPGDLLSPYP